MITGGVAGRILRMLKRDLKKGLPLLGLFCFLKEHQGFLQTFTVIKRKKRLGIIGLAVSITFIVASRAMAGAKFYGGQVINTGIINPGQGLIVGENLASATQWLTAGDSVAITTTPMYGVVANNLAFERVSYGFLDMPIAGRQVTASNSNNDTYYKASGIQETVVLVGMLAYDKGKLISNNGNIQFEGGGANPRLIFNAFNQSNTDQAPSSGPRMLQTSHMTATITSPGESDTAPLSMVTTGDACGQVEIAGSLDKKTKQFQEFSSSLANSQGLYNGVIDKEGWINMKSLHMMGSNGP